MQQLRSILFLLIAVVMGITAVGMELKPVFAPAAVERHAVSHAESHDGPRSDHEHHENSDACLYCHLAKAADLPSRPGTIVVRRQVLELSTSRYAAPCSLEVQRAPWQPRAPPRRIIA